MTRFGWVAITIKDVTEIIVETSIGRNRTVQRRAEFLTKQSGCGDVGAKRLSGFGKEEQGLRPDLHSPKPMRYSALDAKIGRRA